MEDRRIKVREISEIVRISVGAVHYILHEKLEMKKRCARWVPQLLIIDQKFTPTFPREQKNWKRVLYIFYLIY